MVQCVVCTTRRCCGYVDSVLVVRCRLCRLSTLRSNLCARNQGQKSRTSRRCNCHATTTNTTTVRCNASFTHHIHLHIYRVGLYYQSEPDPGCSISNFFVWNVIYSRPDLSEILRFTTSFFAHTVYRPNAIRELSWALTWYSDNDVQRN